MQKARWIVLVSLFFCVSCSAAQKPQVVPVPKNIPRSTETISLIPNADVLRQKSLEARQMLQNIPVGPWCNNQGREIALAGLVLPENKIEIVKIGVCYNKDKDPRLKAPDRLEVITKDYEVTWLEGGGITRYSFDIKNPDGNHLILLDTKHYMQETKTGEYYFPYSDDFLRWEFVDEGAKFLFSAIRDAKDDLRNRHIFSRAYPNTLLADVFPDDFVLNIALIEQIDDEEFSRACPTLEALSTENRIFKTCAEYAAFKVVVHYARNGYNAFRFVKSDMSAYGPLQYTRNTYHRIRQQYPSAALLLNFSQGTADLLNIIKAAICLFDQELADMPSMVRHIFLEDYRLGGQYPAIAYNGGNGRARCFYKHGSKSKNHCGTTRKAWQESIGYIGKYHGIWYIIDLLKERIKYD